MSRQALEQATDDKSRAREMAALASVYQARGEEAAANEQIKKIEALNLSPRDRDRLARWLRSEMWEIKQVQRVQELARR